MKLSSLNPSLMRSARRNAKTSSHKTLKKAKVQLKNGDFPLNQTQAKTYAWYLDAQQVR
jgi:hypothetical protein